MTVHKHLIAHQWIKQTLVPFLLYVFAHTLPYPADISGEVQRSIEFCLSKPDHSSDGDDLTFERIFMATMHRHNNLGPDLSMVVDNLEPLAKYLIRRAQLKGPYELLGRADIGSGTWVAHEAYRLSNITVEPENARSELRPPVRPLSVASKPPPKDNEIDPRLLHAQPGHFAAVDLLGYLTPEEDSYYQQQNRIFEQIQSSRQQQSIYSPAVPGLGNDSYYTLPGTGTSRAMIGKSPYHQHPQDVQAWTPIDRLRDPRLPTGVSAQSDSIPQSQLQQHVSQLRPMGSSTATSRAACVSGPYKVPELQPGLLPSPQTEAGTQNPRHCPDNGLHLSGQPTQTHANTQQGSARLPLDHRPRNQCQPGQRQTTQRPPQQFHQATVRSQQYPPHPALCPDTPKLQTAFVPPPPGTQHPMSGSDFAHLRGTDWSHAAQHRAREIAAKITAQDRDDMAKRIMQRQQSGIQDSTAHTSATHVPSPVVRDPDMPPSSRLATTCTHPCYKGQAYFHSPAYGDLSSRPPCGSDVQYSFIPPTTSSVRSGSAPQMLLQQPLGVQRGSEQWEGQDAVGQLRDAAGVGGGG